MFKFHENQNFHITFANGYTVSVSMQNPERGLIYHYDTKQAVLAEVYVWDRNFLKCSPTPEGPRFNCTPDDVARIISEVAAFPKQA